MRVLAHDPYVGAAVIAGTTRTPAPSTPLATSEVLSVHVERTPQTVGC